MEVSVKYDGLDKVNQQLMTLPGLFSRARKSALKSVGWMVQQELRNHIEYGGTGWPEVHPVTRMTVRRGRWVKRSHPGPMFWLGKFSRYRVEDDGDTIRVDMGKSRKGKQGTFDPFLQAVVRRTEEGETIPVTPKMRALFGATRGRVKNQVPGKTFFPLKKDTMSLKIPRRPVFGPVWNKVNPKIGPWFDKKFSAAVDRYLTGSKKAND